MNQLNTVAHEAAQADYFMGERYDMDSVYYVDGKDWHGAERYYEYPCVYISVLISDYLGFTSTIDADVSIQPHLNDYGSVEFGIPQYDVKYTYGAKGFVLKNLSGKARRFSVDLSALYVGTTKYKLVTKSSPKIVGARSMIELSSQEEASWTPINWRLPLQ